MMSSLATGSGAFAGLRVVLGVSGGIAAYKAAYLLRLLKKADAEVVVTMTESACRFITPLTMATLSGKPVVTSLWDNAADPDLPSDIGHVGLADWADFAVLAPATMNILGKIAGGIADDALSSFFGAFPGARCLLAPAMNCGMWDNPATQANMALLLERGYSQVGPGTGDLACGYSAIGRMAEPAEIMAALAEMAARPRGPLSGRRVLVSAGPTREWIDPVRFWSNGSTGTMGLTLAAAAHLRGAEVTLVAGPGVAPSPPGVRRVDVESAADMADAMLAAAGEADMSIMAAAVADWRPTLPADEKLKKGGESLKLELEPTLDILAEMGRRNLGGFRVGFALESSDLETRAAGKLAAKKAHMIVANLAAPAGHVTHTTHATHTTVSSGFGTGANKVLVLGEGGLRRDLPVMSKERLGGELIDLAAELAWDIR